MVAKRQRKEKTHENRTKEGSRTRARPSGETKALLASPIYIGQAQEGKKKHIKKKEPKLSPSLHASRVYFPLLAK